MSRESRDRHLYPLCFEACLCLHHPREYPNSIQPQAIEDDMRDALRLRPMMNKRGRVGLIDTMAEEPASDQIFKDIMGPGERLRRDS